MEKAKVEDEILLNIEQIQINLLKKNTTAFLQILCNLFVCVKLIYNNNFNKINYSSVFNLLVTRKNHMQSMRDRYYFQKWHVEEWIVTFGIKLKIMGAGRQIKLMLVNCICSG